MHSHYDERAADNCKAQLPNISHVGRGLQGDGYKVSIATPDSESETYLKGERIDSHTGELVDEWVSENINGGKLELIPNLNPDTGYFTLTFNYIRPGREEWSFTTPEIPYRVNE